MIIYKITNLINNKIYVGQSKNTLKERWSQHVSRAKYQKERTHAICVAIRKYGPKNFKIELLEECCSLEDMNNKEKYWASKLNSYSPNGYNLEKCGAEKEKHPSSIAKQCKSYIFLSPDDKFIKIFNLKGFCKDNDLDVCHMYKTHQGKRECHLGYRCAYRENRTFILRKDNKIEKVLECYGAVESFCKENNIINSHFCQLLSGEIKHAKGWKIEIIKIPQFLGTEELEIKDYRPKIITY